MNTYVVVRNGSNNPPFRVKADQVEVKDDVLHMFHREHGYVYISPMSKIDRVQLDDEDIASLAE